MSLINELISFTKDGIYCLIGDFWIDPNKVRPVAIITHAHSDHARRGHGKYICHSDTGELIKLFYGKDSNISALSYGEEILRNGVKITLFPAGHILGSSQVLLEYEGLRVVVAGDYKVGKDSASEPFVPVKCDVFVTESTFAKPHYTWANQDEVFDDINNWWTENKEKGIISVLSAYSLGKSQHILRNLDHRIGSIFVTDQINEINKIYIKSGYVMPQTSLLDAWTDETALKGSLIIAASLTNYPNVRAISNKDIRRVSGWAMDRGLGPEGFPISDHADWNGLNEAIKSSGAKRVYVQHGFTSSYAKYLRGEGYEAFDVSECIKKGMGLELF